MPQHQHQHQPAPEPSLYPSHTPRFERSARESAAPKPFVTVHREFDRVAARKCSSRLQVCFLLWIAKNTWSHTHDEFNQKRGEHKRGKQIIRNDNPGPEWTPDGWTDEKLAKYFNASKRAVEYMKADALERGLIERKRIAGSLRYKTSLEMLEAAPDPADDDDEITITPPDDDEPDDDDNGSTPPASSGSGDKLVLLPGANRRPMTLPTCGRIINNTDCTIECTIDTSGEIAALVISSARRTEGEEKAQGVRKNLRTQTNAFVDTKADNGKQAAQNHAAALIEADPDAAALYPIFAGCFGAAAAHQHFAARYAEIRRIIPPAAPFETYLYRVHKRLQRGKTETYGQGNFLRLLAEDYRNDWNAATEDSTKQLAAEQRRAAQLHSQQRPERIQEIASALHDLRTDATLPADLRQMLESFVDSSAPDERREAAQLAEKRITQTERTRSAIQNRTDRRH